MISLLLQKIGRLLLNPWAIFLAVVAGVVLGSRFNALSLTLAPVGEIYMGLLKMCIIPILLSAITVSLGRLIRSDAAGPTLRRLVIVFVMMLSLTSLVGVGVGVVSGTGENLDATAMSALGSFINKSSYSPDLAFSLSEKYVPKGDQNKGLMVFLLNMVPGNIFTALSEGQNLKILIFSILLGIALGIIPSEKGEPVFLLLDAIYIAFGKLTQWMLYILPITLTTMLAEQVARMGVEVLHAMMSFLIVTLLSFLAVIFINTLIIWKRSDQSYIRSLAGLQETVIMALATRSSFATIPTALNEMHVKLGFNKQLVDLVLPLGITIGRYGNVIYFALGSLFVAQLYGMEMNISSLLVVFVGSILAGMATTGASGIITLTMMGMVLTPLNLPLDAVLVLFIALDPLVDPLRTLTIVHTNCAATALIAHVDAHQLAA